MTMSAFSQITIKGAYGIVSHIIATEPRQDDQLA